MPKHWSIVGSRAVAIAFVGLLLFLSGISIYQLRTFSHVQETLAQMQRVTARIESAQANLASQVVYAFEKKTAAEQSLIGESDAGGDVPVLIQSPMPFGGIDPTQYKTRVTCDIDKASRTMVLLVAGQSNAANYVGWMRHSSYGSSIKNYFNGKCFVAADPLLGADGNSGSLWTELANHLLAGDKYDQVIIIPFAVGGSSMSRWKKGADIYVQLEKLINGLNEQKITITDMVWIQGEGDRLPNSPFYNNSLAYQTTLSGLIELIKRHSNPRFFIAKASSCPNPLVKSTPTAAIRNAQTSILSNARRIFAGPDLDFINMDQDRFDLCHLTAEGASKAISQLEEAFELANRSIVKN